MMGNEHDEKSMAVKAVDVKKESEGNPDSATEEKDVDTFNANMKVSLALLLLLFILFLIFNPHSKPLARHRILAHCRVHVHSDTYQGLHLLPAQSAHHCRYRQNTPLEGASPSSRHVHSR